MFKIFNKKRKAHLAEDENSKAGSRVSRYLLYAIGEIILLVFGILIALQINNWNTGRIENENEIKTYQNIKRQIIEDLNVLTEVKKSNDYFSNQYAVANQIIVTKDYGKMDTLAFIAMNLSQYSDFHRSGNIYETLVNSGEIKLLKNSDITSQLQKLEMTYNYVNKLEDIHWEIIINELSPEMRGVINYSTMEIVKPDKLFSIELQNILIESIYLTKGKDSVYSKALNEINLIVELIDKELSNN